VIVINPVEHAPLQNAKGHLQRIRAKGSSSLIGWQSDFTSIEEMQQEGFGSGEGAGTIIIEQFCSWQ